MLDELSGVCLHNDASVFVTSQVNMSRRGSNGTYVPRLADLISSVKVTHTGAEETAQWIQHLPGKCKNWSSGPQSPHESQVV